MFLTVMLWSRLFDLGFQLCGGTFIFIWFFHTSDQHTLPTMKTSQHQSNQNICYLGLLATLRCIFHWPIPKIHKDFVTCFYIFCNCIFYLIHFNHKFSLKIYFSDRIWNPNTFNFQRIRADLRKIWIQAISSAFI